MYKNWFLNTLSLFVQALPQEVYRELSTGKIHYCHGILVSYMTFIVNILYNTHLLHKMGRQKNHLMYLKGIVVTLGEKKKMNVRIM